MSLPRRLITTLKVEFNLIKIPDHIQIDEIPLDARYRGVLRGLLKRIKGLYEAIYARYGEDGLDLIREVSTKYGSEIANHARKGDEPWDIERVGFYLVKVFNNMRSEGEVTEFSKNRVSIMVPRCPYPFELTQPFLFTPTRIRNFYLFAA